MAERRYVAFVSYKHAKHDAAIAKAVHTAIEEYIIPRALRQEGKRKLGVVFRDEEELPVSSDLTDSICRALDTSEYLIVICSRAAHESPWVRREVEYFLQHHDQRNAFVILADGEPAEVFPEQLTRLNDPETGTCREIEPLAVDVRADSTRASLAKLKKHIRKLIAAMLSCPYDALVQREKKRRARRYAILAALLSAVVLSFMGVLLFKNAELAQANAALQESNTAILLRESQLLTADAVSALEAGDTVAAISAAAAALPSQGNERPYYAPAEAALFAALTPFDVQKASWMLTDTKVEQSTAIADFLFSADGSRVVTIDAYGVVHCYDAASGEERWMRQIDTDQAGYTWGREPRLHLLPDGKTVLCCSSGNNTAYAIEDGSLRWTYSLREWNRSGLSPDGSELAILTDEYDSKSGMSIYSFVTVSTQNGAETRRIELLRDSGWMTRCPYEASGVYLSDSSFAGLYYTEQEDESVLCVYLLDLEEGTHRTAWTSTEQERYARMDFVGMSAVSEHEVLLCFRSDENRYGLAVSLLDLASGEIRWRTVCEEADTGLYADECHVLMKEDAVLIGYDRAMYVLQTENGTIRARTTLQDKLCMLSPLEDKLFVFALVNGYMAVGWENSYGLYDSQFYGITVGLGAVEKAGVWNGGVLALDAERTKIVPISLQDGGGRIGYIPQATPDVLLITKISDVEQLTEKTAMHIGMKNLYLATRLHSMCGSGLAVIGPLSQAGEYDAPYQCLVIDTSNRQVTAKYSFKSAYESDDVLFLPDGSGYVVGDNGSIVLHTSDGQVQTLMEGETLILSEQEDMNIVASMYLTDSAYLHAEGSLLTIACSPKALLIWQNAQKVKQLDLPETLRHALHNGVQVFRMAHAGQNGYVLLSHYADTEDLLMDAFAAYCVETEKWTMIPDEAHGEGNRLVSFAQEKPLFAVCDADNAIRIYSMDAGTLETTLLPGLTASAIEQVEFILDDTHLLVRSGEGLLLIFDLATRENVYRELTEFRQYDAVRADTDAAGRLYITCNDVLSCIQTGGWVKLFQLEDCLFYAPAANEIYRMEAYADTDEITICTVPTTQELVDAALTRLSQ